VAVIVGYNGNDEPPLPVDPEGTVVEANGHAVARLVPIPAGDDEGSDAESAWTREKNARRCFLIDREIDGTLTPEEARELATLQRQMLRHVQRVAPLPLEATRRLYDELLAKAEAARNG
jgi:antitoxin (DNA-binding transcriptional repressor) of toxin-antitoxin stability system